MNEQKFDADIKWYPQNHIMVITPIGFIDNVDIYEIDGHNYIISDYKYNPSTGEFTIKLKRANDILEDMIELPVSPK